MNHVPETMIDFYAREVIRLREEYEFDTFWLGTRVTGQVTEEQVEALRTEINYRVSERVQATGFTPEPTPVKPIARINMHYPQGGIDFRLTPLMIYGRYLKLSREIPASRWPCRRCKGEGCELCGGTGKKFQTSVQELIAGPLMQAACGEAHKLHTSGREDVDARMLGDGRPFILEISLPRVRRLDLQALEAQINQVAPEMAQVRELAFGDRALLDRMMRMDPDKSYRAEVVCLSAAARERVERITSLHDSELSQATPRRVLHRRPNLVRRRVVRECAVEIPPGATVRQFTLTLRVQSGTYVKEFISGDEGRTHPNLSAFLGVPCDCASLDVLAIHADPLA